MTKAVAFYRDLLELKVEFESPYWSQFDTGNGKIGLHPKLQDSTPPLGVFGKGWYLGLATGDIRALRRKLEQEGVKIHGDYHDIPGGVVLDFEDPDGNPIEVIQEGLTTAAMG